MQFDFEELDQISRYKLMTSTIVPRPIGWVTSVDSNGTPNAAPFSFFNGMASEPPLLVLGLMVSLSPNRKKDTAANISETGEFVVHLVNRKLADQMNVCAADYPAGVNELEMAQLTTAASEKVKPPRIVDAPVAFECVRHATMEVGKGDQILVGRIVHMHIQDELMLDVDKKYVDTPKLDLIARMHGFGWYIGDFTYFEMERPSLSETHSLKPE